MFETLEPILITIAIITTLVLLILKKFKLLIQIIVSIALLFLFTQIGDVDFKSIWAKLQNTNWFFFSLATIMFTLTVFTNSHRWLKLAQLLGYKLDYKHALALYFESSFYNNFLPSNLGGDALRSFNLAKEDGNWIKAASTVFVERLFGFSMMFLVIPIGILFLKFSPLANSIPSKAIGALWFSFFACLFGLLSYKLWSKIPLQIITKINYAFQEYTKCHKSMISVIIWTLITHAFLLLGNLFSALSVGIGLDQIPFWYWILMTPLSTLAGFVIPAMKGLGPREACFVYFLGLIGISSTDSLAIAFISFASITVTTIPGFPVIFRKKDIPKN